MVDGMWAAMRLGGSGRVRRFLVRKRHLLVVLSAVIAVLLVMVALLMVQQPTGDVTLGNSPATATALPDVGSLVIAPQTLTWGGDIASGAPYLFVDPAHPTVVTGLDADLMNAVAAHLHLHAQFQQTAWATFPRTLHARTIDLFADGVIPAELPPGVAIYSTPYLMTSDEIVVRTGDKRFSSIASLEHHLVGVVTGDRAAADVAAVPAITQVPFAQALPFEALAAGRIDAVVISAPLARWFGGRDPLHRFTVLPAELHLALVSLALPISHATSFALRDRISQVLQAMTCDGSLKQILLRWGLTSPVQQWLATHGKDECTSSPQQ